MELDKNNMSIESTRPIIFLDIDGVLNADEPHGDRASVFIPAINHPDKHFSKTVVSRLNAIHRNNDVSNSTDDGNETGARSASAEIRWLTGWYGAAVTIFAPSVGLDSFREAFHLPNYSVWPSTKDFYVSKALNTEPGRLIIWIDDEATLLKHSGYDSAAGRKYNWNWYDNQIKEESIEPRVDVCKLYKSNSSYLMCISPNPCHGLKIGTLDLIESFLLEYDKGRGTGSSSQLDLFFNNSLLAYGDEVKIVEDADDDPDFRKLFDVYEAEKVRHEGRVQRYIDRGCEEARTIDPNYPPIIRDWDGKDNPPGCICSRCDFHASIADRIRRTRDSTINDK